MNVDSKQMIKNKLLGEILLQSGRMDRADVEHALKLQEEEELYFGEAVLRLGLASRADVQSAIACQFAHPYLSNGDNTISKQVIAAYAPFAPQIEALREVRTALLLSGAGVDLKSICVASCRQGDGKTFVAANLAVIFAQLGYKTLLMDFNLRQPKIHKLFCLKNSYGVSSLLINRSTLQEAVQASVFETLNILPGGPKPPNPLELVARPGARQLMKKLKSEYEIIIVRAPSLERAADVSSLVSFMDGVCLVALQGKTCKDELGKAKSILEETGARLLGIVLNQQ